MTTSLLDRHSSTPSELKLRLEADRRGHPYLVYRCEEGVQRIVDLDEHTERLTIGRSKAADVPLTWDLSVSRHHAILERSIDGWSLLDDGRSLNGTYVNQQRIRGRRRLRDRDIVQIGDTVLAFRAPSRRESLATLPAITVPAPVRISNAQRRVLVALCRPFGDGRPFATPATNEEIAAELVLSVDAVKTHLRALFGHFGLEALPRAQKRARLAERALQTGTVTEADYDAAHGSPHTRG